VLTYTEDRIVPDPGKTLREGALDPWARSWRRVFWPRLEKLAKERDIALDVPWKKLPATHRKLLIEGGKEFRGAIPFLKRLQEKSYKAGNRFIVKRYQSSLPCEGCEGRRLRPEALRVHLGGRSIADVCAMTVAAVAEFLAALAFTEAQRGIAGPVLVELESRLRFLLRVDLGYLTIDRLTRTLSGGEAQRIELANALGANLADTLYVLDEPTVGLHPRDSERLVAMLDELAARGNTLVVVEHEPLLMRAARHLVDLGPGAGEQGGRVLYAGPGGDAIADAAPRPRAISTGTFEWARRSATKPARHPSGRHPPQSQGLTARARSGGAAVSGVRGRGRAVWWRTCLPIAR
jgi:excinuclease ABC subunit A